MKRLWVFLAAVVLLSSCTSVDDFGSYWDKGVVDPALAGTWKKISLPGENAADVAAPEMWRFTRDGAGYTAEAINPSGRAGEPRVMAPGEQDNDLVFSARSLRLGKHLLLMMPDRADDR